MQKEGKQKKNYICTLILSPIAAGNGLHFPLYTRSTGQLFNKRQRTDDLLLEEGGLTLSQGQSRKYPLLPAVYLVSASRSFVAVPINHLPPSLAACVKEGDVIVQGTIRITRT